MEVTLEQIDLLRKTRFRYVAGKRVEILKQKKLPQGVKLPEVCRVMIETMLRRGE